MTDIIEIHGVYSLASYADRKRQSRALCGSAHTSATEYMKITTDISAVFAAYGHAAYYAQLLEYDLVSIWMLDSITQGVTVTQEDLHQFQGEWSKKTLGKLLNPLRQSSLIPDDLKEFLETIRTTRNTLAHDFFLNVADDLRTSEGREKTKAKLEQMGKILAKGQEFFVNVLTTYGKDFGIDYNAIRRELLEQSKEDAEPAGAGDA
jgi:hypothetical protein